MTRRVLNEWMVRSARELVRLRAATVPELAEDYEVNERTLQRAVYGETWREVPGALDSGQKPIRRLSEQEVREILKSDQSSYALAERYGVADSTVRHIRTGRTWAGLST